MTVPPTITIVLLHFLCHFKACIIPSSVSVQYRPPTICRHVCKLEHIDSNIFLQNSIIGTAKYVEFDVPDYLAFVILISRLILWNNQTQRNRV